MKSAPRLPGPRPSWYRRLPPSLRAVAEQSDRYPALPLRPPPALLDAVSELPAALASGVTPRVQDVAQRVADGVCQAFGVSEIRVRVEARRPSDARGELHGLYFPGHTASRSVVTVWMRTAKRQQTVAPRTFLRTLLHELCHHLDYTYLRLRSSLHSQGFYRRESSLVWAIDRALAASRSGRATCV